MEGTYTVVSSFGPKGYTLYGERFIRTFQQYWPPSVRLLLYVEDTRPKYSTDARTTIFDLDKVSNCKDFLVRHSGNSAAHGLVPTQMWKSKCRREGYNFRFDAYRFCRKVFTIADAVKQIGEHGKLVWLDADVVTHRAVPDSLLEWILPEGYSISYLDRAPYHSECGIVGYNLDLGARNFIEEFSQLYATDAVFKLAEWHDSYVFDQVREHQPDSSRFYKIPHNGTSHPFNRSQLRNFLIHLKGDLKVTYANSTELGFAR